MMNHKLANDMSYSLLIIIVNRGKGSKILQFAHQNGASDASCFFGKGTIKSSLLRMIEMNEVDKEIILIVVPGERENEILNHLNMKFHFDHPNHGIAFTIPLAGVLRMKRDSAIRWKKSSSPAENQSDYTAILVIVDKGKADKVIQISQNAGYYGGTVIKARGSADKINRILDMIVEPEKEAVLMLKRSERANQLAVLLNDQLQLDQPNMGILVKIGISKAIGLFRNSRQNAEVDE